MGYVVTAYAVELSKVSGALGSKNKRLISALVKKFGDDFEQFDEMAADIADDEDVDALTMHDALTHMVMGETYNEEFGFLYGYALEFLCSHFGASLPNEEWSAMPAGSDWATTVDKALKAAGVPEKVFRVGSHLMNRGSPITLPEIEDFPAIGYLKLSEAKAAQKALGEAKVAAIKDKEVSTSIREIQCWLQSCVKAGADLLCFYA